METHELPDVLSPAGDTCYPLFIPNNPQWRQLILGIIHQLADENYYRDLAFVPNDVSTVCDRWMQSTLAPLVQSMNDESDCSSIPAMTITDVAAQRTSNISISTFPYAVVFQTGTGFDAGNPTQLTPPAGDVVLQANIHFTANSANIGYVEIRKNIGTGTIVLARQDLSGVTINYVNLSAIDVANGTDFYELVIQSNLAITIQSGTFLPQLACKVFS